MPLTTTELEWMPSFVLQQLYITFTAAVYFPVTIFVDVSREVFVAVPTQAIAVFKIVAGAFVGA